MHGSAIRFKDFRDYVSENIALDGFNLTTKLMQQLYCFLDPHKKGYLSEVDWQKAFGNFMGQVDVACSDVKENICNNFSSAFQAYDFFTGGHNSKSTPLTSKLFRDAVKCLFNDSIYSAEMIQKVWDQAL